ncbi:aspartate kinase, partial [Candidatus Aminicenantes bacterium AC-335-G13]|nr:aspartate kinase [Candidatus Aminicenantes bacterium AC-335-G13]
LTQNGIKATELESEKIKIITDDSFENATVDLKETKLNFEKHVVPLLNKGIIPVITGYYGCTKKGKITTFGRNGSDYSAAVVAYALNSPILEIWKDVDGFMSADPKIVRNAKRITRLSHYEAAELSYFGAKILHPRTVEPLTELKTKIIIRNFYKDGGRGTLILPKGYVKKNIVKSVTFNNEIGVFRIYGPGVGYKPGIIGEIGNLLSQKGINIYSILTSQTCINLLINKRDLEKSHEVLNNLCGGVIEKFVLVRDIALIAVVGEGIKKRKGIAAKVFSAVAKKNINVEMISSGASEVAYYFVVKEKDLKKAVIAIHDEFF